MPKTDYAELPDRTRIPILYEDRSVLALDKPPGWVLGPDDEERSRRNLQVALTEGIDGGAFWARSRNLRYLRFVHRLDGPTSGVLLWVKAHGGVRPYSQLFSDRTVEKTYFAVVEGVPRDSQWLCRLPLGPDPAAWGRHRVDTTETGKPAETEFRVLASMGNRTLVEARPHTGRTHQIRLHLLAAGFPVVGDELYGRSDRLGLGLRALRLSYRDPFTRRPVRIQAASDEWCTRFGFSPAPVASPSGQSNETPATVASAPKSVGGPATSASASAGLEYRRDPRARAGG